MGGLPGSARPPTKSASCTYVLDVLGLLGVQAGCISWCAGYVVVKCQVTDLHLMSVPFVLD